MLVLILTGCASSDTGTCGRWCDRICAADPTACSPTCEPDCETRREHDEPS